MQFFADTRPGWDVPNSDNNLGGYDHDRGRAAGTSLQLQSEHTRYVRCIADGSICFSCDDLFGGSPSKQLSGSSRIGAVLVRGWISRSRKVRLNAADALFHREIAADVARSNLRGQPRLCPRVYYYCSFFNSGVLVLHVPEPPESDVKGGVDLSVTHFKNQAR